MDQRLLLQTEQADSPFLPGTKVQYAIDSTSLEWYKRCPRLYQLSMIEGWVPNEDSADLYFGIEVHQAFHEYDIAKAKGVPQQAILRSVLRNLLQRTENWSSDHKYKNRRSLVRTVLWYLFHFQEDAAKTHILSDGRPAVELSFRFELDWGPTLSDSQPYLLCGHLDRVVDFNGDLFVMDYKTTTKTPGAYYFDQFEPNNQMSLYTLAGQVVIHSPIKGVIINAIQVLVDSVRPVRSFTYRTQDQLEEWLLDLRYWTGRMEESAALDYWPMNDTACDKYGGCKFRRICSRSPQVREQLLKADFTRREPWNPLRSR